MPQNLLTSLDSVESHLQFTLCDVMDRVNILTTAFDASISSANDKEFVPMHELTFENFEILKDLLILNRQHEIYVRRLLGNLKVLKAKILQHVTSYRDRLLSLHETVEFKSAVPSSQVFPRFKEIAEDWIILHNLSYVLCHQNQINNYLQHLSELCRQQQYDEVVHTLLGERQVETDLTRLQNRRHLKLILRETSAQRKKVSIVSPPASNSEIEYLGFCTHALSESRILLVSANY